jgi:hypothetical protein
LAKPQFSLSLDLHPKPNHILQTPLHDPFMSFKSFLVSFFQILTFPIPHIAFIVPMSLKNLKVLNFRTILTLATVVLSLVHLVQCQDVNDYNNQFNNPAVLPLITQVVYRQISNLTAVIGQDIGNQSSFCIKDW